VAVRISADELNDDQVVEKILALPKLRSATHPWRLRLMARLEALYTWVEYQLKVPKWLRLYPLPVRFCYALAPWPVERLLIWWGRRALRKAAEPLASDDREYVLGKLREMWSYYDKYGRKWAKNRYSGLIPDHVTPQGASYLERTDLNGQREGRLPGHDSEIVYAPTSPTNVAYHLMMTCMARRLGFIDESRAEGDLAEILEELETGPLWNGILHNFRHSVTGQINDRFLSFVDVGNLSSALATVGSLYPGAVGRKAERLREEIGFELLYDEKAGIPYNGYSPDTQQKRGHYDLQASEASNAVLEAIALGLMPWETWFRMGNWIVDSQDGPIIVSCSGSVMEFLTANAFANKAKIAPHIWGLIQRRLVKAQQRYAASIGLGKLFGGFSESAYYAKDSEGNQVILYLTQGVPTIGSFHELLKGRNAVDVLSAYGLAMMAPFSPKAVVKALREYEHAGGGSLLGFYEALQVRTDGIRIPGLPYSGGKIAPVKTVMAHHTGMAGLGLLPLVLPANDPFFKAYEGRPEIQNILPLLSGRPPLKTPVSRRPVAAVPPSQYLGWGNSVYGTVVDANGRAYSKEPGARFGVAMFRDPIEMSDGRTQWPLVGDPQADYAPGTVALKGVGPGIEARGEQWQDSDNPLDVLRLTLTNWSTADREISVRLPLRLVSVARPEGPSLNCQATVTLDGRGVLLTPPDSQAPVVFHSVDIPPAFLSPISYAGALQLRIPLKPGETLTFHVITGMASDSGVAKRLMWRYDDADVFQSSLAKSKAQNREKIQYVGGLSVANHVRWETVAARLMRLGSAETAIAGQKVCEIIKRGIAAGAVFPWWAAERYDQQTHTGEVASGLPAVLYRISSRRDLRGAFDLVQLQTLWRENGLRCNVLFYIDVLDPDERALIDQSMKTSFVHIHPGWNYVPEEDYYILYGPHGTTPGLPVEDQAALAKLAADVSAPRDQLPRPNSFSESGRDGGGPTMRKRSFVGVALLLSTAIAAVVWPLFMGRAGLALTGAAVLVALFLLWRIRHAKIRQGLSFKGGAKTFAIRLAALGALVVWLVFLVADARDWILHKFIPRGGLPKAVSEKQLDAVHPLIRLLFSGEDLPLHVQSLGNVQEAAARSDVSVQRYSAVAVNDSMLSLLTNRDRNGETILETLVRIKESNHEGRLLLLAADASIAESLRASLPADDPESLIRVDFSPVDQPLFNGSSVKAKVLLKRLLGQGIGREQFGDLCLILPGGLEVEDRNDEGSIRALFAKAVVCLLDQAKDLWRLRLLEIDSSRASKTSA